MFERRNGDQRTASRPLSGYPEGVPVSSHDVASVLRRRIPGVATKKLHKLLYYCQGHHLATFGEPLFDESISAWDMGPVVGRLWHHDKKGTPSPAGAKLSEGQLNTIGFVVSRYGRLTGRDLQHLTHSEDPWLRADANRLPRASTLIQRSWIQEYFTSMPDDDDDDEGLLDSHSVTAWLQDAEERRHDTLRPDTLDEIRARLSSRA